jgi:diaminopimelate epimerase
MYIPFTKASACGNDFLIVEGANAPEDLSATSRRMCDRHNGVGADGVEWLYFAQDADASARLFNADGTEAEVSGNGTRCVAAYMVDGGGKEKLAIRTGAGIKYCRLVARNDKNFTFEMDMGEPEVGKPFPVSIRSGEVLGTPVSMGNPHFVVFVKEFSPSWQEEGAGIGRSPVFKDGVNVEFVRVTSKNDIDVRFYERGVGETQSSGTGSCASAVATIAGGYASSPVNVHAPGGTQLVSWTNDRVLLRGPAQIVCQGGFFA